MKIGIGLPNQVRNVDPRLIPRWAAAAEEAGFSSLGTVGRYAYPGLSDTDATSCSETAMIPCRGAQATGQVVSTPLARITPRSQPDTPGRRCASAGGAPVAAAHDARRR